MLNNLVFLVPRHFDLNDCANAKATSIKVKFKSLVFFVVKLCSVAARTSNKTTDSAKEVVALTLDQRVSNHCLAAPVNRRLPKDKRLTNQLPLSEFPLNMPFLQHELLRAHYMSTTNHLKFFYHELISFNLIAGGDPLF